MLRIEFHLSSKAHNHWSFYLDCPSLSLNLMLNAWDLMLWERPITLRMMFLPQNLAKNDAKNKQTQKDWGLKRRVQSEFGISTLDYIQEIRAKSPSRRISKIKNSNRKVPDAVIVYIAQLGWIKWVAVRWNPSWSHPTARIQKKIKTNTDHSVIKFDATRRYKS